MASIFAICPAVSVLLRSVAMASAIALVSRSRRFSIARWMSSGRDFSETVATMSATVRFPAEKAEYRLRVDQSLTDMPRMSSLRAQIRTA